MKTILAVMLLACLSACGSLTTMFENRATCTLDGKQMLVASMYGPIGIASKVSKEDAAVVCKVPTP